MLRRIRNLFSPTPTVVEPTRGVGSAASYPAVRLFAGCYQLRRPLGQGGMGFVFEGEHLPTRREVAIKLSIPSTQAWQRFAREAENLRRLEHPHIVRWIDHGVDDGTPFLIMELLRGETLGERLRRDRFLPVSETLRLIEQLGSALSYAHQAGTIHRDLKPDNVFLDEGEGAVSVKLLDFGVSIDTRTPTRLTNPGQLVGTPLYMSPEQASGPTTQVDERSDQFSLAVIAYEMFTARHPFETAQRWSLLERIAREEVPRASSVRRRLPARFDAVLARGLEKDPARRYPSVADFVQALCEPAPHIRTRTQRAKSRRDAQWAPRGIASTSRANDSNVLTMPCETPRGSQVGALEARPGEPVATRPLAALVRQLRAIEAALSAGNHGAAARKARSILAFNPFNTDEDCRELLALCDVLLKTALNCQGSSASCSLGARSFRVPKIAEHSR